MSDTPMTTPGRRIGIRTRVLALGLVGFLGLIGMATAALLGINHVSDSSRQLNNAQELRAKFIQLDEIGGTVVGGMNGIQRDALTLGGAKAVQKNAPGMTDYIEGYSKVLF